MPPRKNRSAEVLADPDPGENMDTSKRVLRSRPSLTQSSEASQKPKASKRNSANQSRSTAAGREGGANKERTSNKDGDNASRAMAAPARPRTSLLNRFMVNDQNNIMSDSYSLSLGTPFNNEGDLPQRVVNDMRMQKRRSAKRARPSRETAASSSMPTPGVGTQDMLNEHLSSQDTVRHLLGLQKTPKDPQHDGDSEAPSSLQEMPVPVEELMARLREEDAAIEDQRSESPHHESSASTDDSLYADNPPRPGSNPTNPKGKGRASMGSRSHSIRHARTTSAEALAVPYEEPLGIETSADLEDSSMQDGPQPEQKFDYNKYKDDGLTVLAALAYSQAKRRRWTVATQMSEEDWRAIAVPMMCSMRSQDIEDLIDGFPINADRDEAEQDVWDQNGRAEAPVIYARGLCETHTGRSLTAREMHEVLVRLQLYITQELNELQIDLVKAVDDATARSGSATKTRYIKEGRRHFFGNNWLSVEAHRRREIVGIFCRQCEASLRTVTELEADEPLRVFYYIGYTLKFSARMAEHKNTDSASSWFMNLFLSACKAVHDVPDRIVWGFADSALCYCADEKEAPVGEVLLTLLARAWYSDGDGLGIHPPGLSVASSTLNTRTMDAARKLWQSCDEFRKEHTPFLDNMDMEMQRIQAYPARYAQRVRAMTSRIPDVQDEARLVQERFTDKKHRLRLQMEHDLEGARDNFDHFASFFPPDRREEEIQKLNADLSTSAEELKALGANDQEDVDDEEDEAEMLPRSRTVQPPRSMDLESFLPDYSQYNDESHRDVALPSKEPAEPSPWVGPSNYKKQAH